MANMLYVHSQKGGRMLVMRDYSFTCEECAKGSVYWRCQYRGCIARALESVNDERVKEPPKVHEGRLPDRSDIEKIRDNYKEASRSFI